MIMTLADIITINLIIIDYIVTKDAGDVCSQEGWNQVTPSLSAAIG